MTHANGGSPGYPLSQSVHSKSEVRVCGGADVTSGTIY